MFDAKCLCVSCVFVFEYLLTRFLEDSLGVQAQPLVTPLVMSYFGNSFTNTFCANFNCDSFFLTEEVLYL